MAQALNKESLDFSLAPPGKPVPFGQVQALHDDAAPALKVLRQALALPLRVPPERSAARPAHLYMQWRTLTHLLKADMLYYRSAGEYANAADALLDCVELGAAVENGAGFFSALVGSAIERVGASELPYLLAKLNREELGNVCTRLERIRQRRPPWPEIIREEGRSYTAMMVDSCTHTYGGIRAFNYFRDPGPSLSAIRLLFGDKTAWLKENAAYYERLARAAAGPYRGPVHIDQPVNPLMEYALEPSQAASPAHVRARAQCEILLLEAALRAFSADHGHYPDRLDALAPRYLQSIPVDPYGGGAFRYRPLNGGDAFLLYSIGEDLKDNGGVRCRNPLDGCDLPAKGFWIGCEPPRVSGAPVE